MNNFSQGVRDYFQLRDVNQMLAEQNAALKEQVSQLKQLAAASDSAGVVRDSAVLNQFGFESAKVVE